MFTCISRSRYLGYKKRNPRISFLIAIAIISLITFIGLEFYWRHHAWWNDITGVPMDKYEWPLKVDADKLVREYKNGELKIQPITRDNSSITLFPSKVICKENILVTVLIKTRVEDRYNRDLLRRTWIEDLHKDNLQHSFLLGQCKSDKCKMDLASELVDHQDILQGDFIDAYHNNTMKFRMGLKYIAYHCNRSSYVLIIDGDYSLNVKRLLKYLKELQYPKNLYAGRLWPDSRPFREPGHPQYMSYEFYPFRRLPPFIAAGASLLSTEIVEPLNIVAQFTKYVEFDDVFYGMVAKKLGILLVDATHLLPSYFAPKIYDIDVHKSIIGSHRYGNLAEVVTIHGHIHS